MVHITSCVASAACTVLCMLWNSPLTYIKMCFITGNSRCLDGSVLEGEISREIKVRYALQEISFETLIFWLFLNCIKYVLQHN